MKADIVDFARRLINLLLHGGLTMEKKKARKKKTAKKKTAKKKTAKKKRSKKKKKK